MAWTEPGQNEKPNNDKKNEQGPPNLDDAFRQLNDKFNSFLGKKKKPSGTGNKPSNGGTSPLSRFAIIAGIVIVFLIWVLSGIFIVSPPEQAVILQFGKYQSTVGPGPHWIPRFIRTERTVNTQRIDTYSYSAQMLTKDQNIVDVAVAVQYRIAIVKNYLFNVASPTLSLQQATASALRQVIGGTNLDDILTSGRAVVRDNIITQLNKILAIYKTGIIVTDVALQPAKAPEQVKDAFDDAIKAQEDEQRYVNQAEAYARGVVPIAEGNAKRITQEASAYQQQIVLRAQADTARYLAVLPVYMQAPKVTRDRMYLTTLEQVLGAASKVFVDTNNGHNFLYLPLDKLVGKQAKRSSQDDADAAIRSLATTGNLSTPTTDSTSSNTSRSTRPSRFSYNPDSSVR